MSAEQPARHVIDVDQAFTGDASSVRYLAELLERSLADHEPVLSVTDPACEGCTAMHRAYFDLLAQLVALVERATRAERERVQTERAFRRAARHAWPEFARQRETNPRIGKPLDELPPELLANQVIAWAQRATDEAFEQASRKADAEAAELRQAIARLSAENAALRAERDAAAGLRDAIVPEDIDVPGPLLDRLFAGRLDLVTFLRHLAGAGGATTLRHGNDEVTVALHAPTPATTAASPAPAPAPPAAPPSPRASSRPGAAAAPPAPAPLRLVPDPATAPPERDAGPSAAPPRATRSATAVQDSAVQVILEHDCWTRAALATHLEPTGLSAEQAIAALQSARLTTYVPTGTDDGLLYPTDAFVEAAIAHPGAELYAASYRGMATLTRALGRDQRTSVAKVITPFFSGGWHLLFLTCQRDGTAIWCSLQRDEDDEDTRHRTGTLAVLLGPPPYHPPSPRHRDPAKVLWAAGHPAHLAALAAPEGLDVWHLDLARAEDETAWRQVVTVSRRPLR